MDGGDHRVILRGVLRDQYVFIEELDVVYGVFVIFAAAGGEGKEQIKLWKLSWMGNEVLAYLRYSSDSA